MRYQDKKIILPEEVKNVYAIGDIHGEFMPVVNDLLESCKLKDAAVVICGDIGMGFNSKNWYISMFRKMEHRLEEKNVYLIMFRGNHDDPEYFKYVENDLLSDSFPHCILADDFSIVETDEEKAYPWRCLLWGGARSIDKCQRIIGQTYWKGEMPLPLPDEFKKEFLDNKHEIHCVCSHTAPSICFPKTKGLVADFAKYDKTVEEDCKKERELLTEGAYSLKAANLFTLKLWCYGHFHDTIWNYMHASSELNLLGIQFIGLDMFRNSFYCKEFVGKRYDLFKREHGVNIIKIYDVVFKKSYNEEIDI